MATSQSIAIARAFVGLAQGIALYLLYRSGEVWPATTPYICAALRAVAIFIPVVVVAGLGNLRSRTLAAWAIVAAACCAGLAVYDIFREPLAGGRLGLFWMTLSLWLSLGSVLFIVHSLIDAGVADRRLVASYTRYSDVAWKHGVQLPMMVAIAVAFLAALPFTGLQLLWNMRSATTTLLQTTGATTEE